MNFAADTPSIQIKNATDVGDISFEAISRSIVLLSKRITQHMLDIFVQNSIDSIDDINLIDYLTYLPL